MDSEFKSDCPENLSIDTKNLGCNEVNCNRGIGWSVKGVGYSSPTRPSKDTKQQDQQKTPLPNDLALLLLFTEQVLIYFC